MSAHMTPEQVRSKIDHPIVDGDGHWVEYDPVFSEKMRKVGGDLAADGFLNAMGTTREALSMTVAERRHKRMGFWGADGLQTARGPPREALFRTFAERRHKRMGQQAFWSRQAENTLD